MFQLSYPIDFVRPAKKDYVQGVVFLQQLEGKSNLEGFASLFTWF